MSLFSINYGDTFATQDAYIDKVMDWAMDSRFLYQIQRRDKSHLVVTCGSSPSSHCKFYLRLSVKYQKGYTVGGFQFNNIHECIFEPQLWKSKNPGLRLVWLRRRINEIMSIQHDTLLMSIQQRIAECWSVAVPIKVCNQY